MSLKSDVPSMPVPEAVSQEMSGKKPWIAPGVSVMSLLVTSTEGGGPVTETMAGSLES